MLDLLRRGWGRFRRPNAAHHKRRRNPSPARPSVRPRLDPLEDRFLLSGTPLWQELMAPTLTYAGPMELLSNGNVLVHEYYGSTWSQLQPDAFGDYATGTWPQDRVSTMPADAQGAFDRWVFPS